MKNQTLIILKKNMNKINKNFSNRKSLLNNKFLLITIKYIDIYIKNIVNLKYIFVF